jgi:hypothetical protein
MAVEICEASFTLCGTLKVCYDHGEEYGRAYLPESGVIVASFEKNYVHLDKNKTQ